MDLTDYLRVLRRRWRSATAAVLLCLVAAIALTQALPKTYEATAQLFVSAALSDGSDPSGLYQGGQFAQARVKSYADIMTSPVVIAPVISRLGLDTTPKELGEAIQATAPVDTVLINVTVKDAQPERAQLVADAVAREFIGVVTRIERPSGQVTSPLRVSLVRPADLPTDPASPKPLINVVLGLIVGLAAAVVTAVVREHSDTRLASATELEELTGLPCLAVIGFDREARAEPVLRGADASPRRAEAFRKFRTNLRFVSLDEGRRSLLVTSALPGEGKSTTVANLGVALAQTGVRVLLVEADLRHPQLAGYMDLEGAMGLTDVLIGRVSWEHAVQPWRAGELSVLAAGATPPNPSELLASEQMGLLVSKLERAYDFVLFDSPPVLAVTDAAVLAAQIGGTVLAVRSGSTRRKQVLDALEALGRVGAPVRGTVLTMAKRVSAEEGRDYGYAYAPDSLSAADILLRADPVPPAPSATPDPQDSEGTTDPPVPLDGPEALAGTPATDPPPR